MSVEILWHPGDVPSNARATSIGESHWVEIIIGAGDTKASITFFFATEELAQRVADAFNAGDQPEAEDTT